VDDPIGHVHARRRQAIPGEQVRRGRFHQAERDGIFLTVRDVFLMRLLAESGMRTPRARS
jgi:hypothetical protein